MTPANGVSERSMTGEAALRARFSLVAIATAGAAYLILLAGLRVGAGSAVGESLSLLVCLGFLGAAKRRQIRTRGVHDLPQFLVCLALMAVAYALYFSLRSSASAPVDGLTLAYPLILSYLDQYLGSPTQVRFPGSPLASRATAASS